MGVVSAANSLIGGSPNDKVGFPGVTPLTNGHYVVCSRNWTNPSTVTANVGAVTWGNGTSGIVGPVSTANSLIGSTADDNVGASGVTALSNGNYVVRNPNWDNPSPPAVNVGAVTWGNGSTGIVGSVSASNSLIGSTANDNVGNVSVTALANGNYVVCSWLWDNPSPARANVGAATWGNGTMGIVGAISAANSLIGSTENDSVGLFGARALTNGNYVVVSPEWNNPSPVTESVGAATWGNGATGIVGTISASNSLIGSAANDSAGEGDVTALANGHYVVHNDDWDNPSPATSNAGAKTLGNGNTGTSGIITNANSVLGTALNGGGNLTFGYDASREQLVVGRRHSNIVTLMSEAGKVSLGSTLFTATEAAGVANITLNRTGGTNGAASVILQTTPGTATAGTGGDYLPIVGQVVNFADRESSKTVPVTLLGGNAANEANETFGVSLTTPVGVTLGSIASAKVRIIDAGDATIPGAPVITTPAANALVGVNAGGTMNATGTASDGKGIAMVEVQLNGGAFLPATLTNVNGTSAGWSAIVTPVTGTNTIRVRSTDTSGNISAVAARTFKATRPLVVRTSGAGTVTTGFVPTSFREAGTSFTLSATASATPAPGTLFAGWTVSGPNLTQMGIVPSALDRPSITFIFREGLQLVANFVPNPFTNTVTGTYKGLVQASYLLPDRPPFDNDGGPEDGTLPDNSTEGLLNVTLQSTGAFSASLTMDGLVLNFAGLIDQNGNARFGTARTLTMPVARTGKPSLVVAFKVDGAPVVGNFGTISGTVTAVDYRGEPTAVSIITADRAFYNGTTQLVPPQYLGPNNANGIFNVVFPARPVGDQPAGFQENWYPQGDGIGTLTITKAGVVTLSNCTLADGTVATASTTLSESLRTYLFLPLYSKKGYLSTRILLDNGNPQSDLAAEEVRMPSGNARWLRPAQNTHHYPAGWPEIIKVGLLGAKYNVVTGLSSLKSADGADAGDTGDNLQAPDADGNAALQLSDGQLEATLLKAANVSTADVVTKVPGNDPTFTLGITRATGLFTGTFRHTNETVPTFKGILYQKGTNAGGYGFFLTVPPAPITYTGESGGVSLIGKP